MNDFVSAFRSLYDSFVEAGPTPAGALSLAIEFEDARNLALPPVYVSTTITSAGYKRDSSLGGREGIDKNNRSAQLIMSALIEHGAPHITAADVMLPTEIGKVPGWRDSDYLTFYFGWLSGLTGTGLAWVEEQLRDPVYDLETVNARAKSNEERWPQYLLFTEDLLVQLQIAESRRGGKRAEGSQLLLQLVDVNESLGCRAEKLFADFRGLDCVAPTFAGDLPGPLGQDIAALTVLKASVGAKRKPVELVPTLLR